MDIRKLQRAIVDGLEDVKAQDIRVFDTEHLSPLFERVIVASGTSNRQTKALASSVRDRVKARGMQVMRTEGEDTGEWIIVDCGAAVVHVMQPAIRQYYNLEELWGEKAVRMKLGADGAVQLALPKAAPRKAPAKATAAVDKAAPRKLPARKTAAGKKSAPRRASPAVPKHAATNATSPRGPERKAPAKKAPPRRKTT
jgi:ribosome-associated protein